MNPQLCFFFKKPSLVSQCNEHYFQVNLFLTHKLNTKVYNLKFTVKSARRKEVEVQEGVHVQEKTQNPFAFRKLISVRSCILNIIFLQCYKTEI